MSVLFYGFCLVFIALFIHFSVWKIRLPHNQTKTLLGIFSATLAIGGPILWKYSADIRFFGITAPATIHEYLILCIFFVSLTLAYVTTYSALEVDSPSLVMVMEIAKAGSKGLDKNVLSQKLNNDILVIPRIKDLVIGNLVYLDGNIYKLTEKGLFIARLFAAYRKLMEKTEKGG